MGANTVLRKAVFFEFRGDELFLFFHGGVVVVVGWCFFSESPVFEFVEAGCGFGVLVEFGVACFADVLEFLVFVFHCVCAVGV